jgi:SAM-dependent methyltransferase
MRQQYWNRFEKTYDAEIFDVQAHDRKSQIAKLIRKFGGKEKTASDIGCGPGKFLPLLSKHFGSVQAVDISPKLVMQARIAHQQLDNIEYTVRDISSRKTALPFADFSLSVNAFLDPSFARLSKMFDTIARHLNPGGILVMVVPSFESAVLTDLRLVEWNRRRGLKGNAALRSGWDEKNRILNSGLQQCIVKIDSVQTKHYLAEEMVFLLAKRNLEILDYRKIEYPWQSSFVKPPSWMKAPYPWDWLFLARKTEI